MRRDRFDKPPTEWGIDAVAVGGDIYYTRDDELKGAEAYLVWHWCPEIDRWRAAGVGRHDLVKADPLHFEPSMLWPCCGTHGWIRNGRWVPC